jgi:decaprenylphospho-beta-D-ribofuranose 2-oxidase
MSADSTHSSDVASPRDSTSPTASPDALSLRANAGWRVLGGFGGAVRSASRFVEPRSGEELADVLASARREGLTVTFRGAGRSYGDAALNTGGVVADLRRLNGVSQWDPALGVIECGPGLSIEGLWRRTVQDGYWPAVVPGTMHPTLGGCLSMNVHGKNNFREGTFGEHVLDFDLVTPRGELLRCSRTENADVFVAAIGGMGLLGAITRVRLKLKPVETGFLRVEALAARNLDEAFDRFEESLPDSDYVVGWVDCLARGRGLGRGELHRARYVPATEVDDVEASFRVENQGLPSSILMLPKAQLWRLMRPLAFDGGVRLVNAAKYLASVWHDGNRYLQSHVAFAFLLDYLPNWQRGLYGNDGFIQYQVFIPHETARAALRAILTRCIERGLYSYLGVLKRHRPDDFVLSHAVDGWSLAMDFPAAQWRREQLWKLTDELTAIVLDAGGRFYFAKDAVLRHDDVERSYGRARVERFLEIKARLDPDWILTSDLWRRIGLSR